METQYDFGTRGSIEILRTKSDTHTNLSGWNTIERKYPDQIVTDRFFVTRKYATKEDADGNCYDWYEIASHYRECDKTPVVHNETAHVAADVDYLAMMVDVDIHGEA